MTAPKPEYKTTRIETAVTGALVASILAGAALAAASVWIDGQAGHALMWTGIIVGVCGVSYSLAIVCNTPPNRGINPFWAGAAATAIAGVVLGIVGLWNPDRFGELAMLAVIVSVPGSLAVYGLVLATRKRSPVGGAAFFCVMVVVAFVLVKAVYADAETAWKLFMTAMIFCIVGGGFSLVIAGPDRDES